MLPVGPHSVGSQVSVLRQDTRGFLPQETRSLRKETHRYKQLGMLRETAHPAPQRAGFPEPGRLESLALQYQPAVTLSSTTLCRPLQVLSDEAYTDADITAPF